MHEPVKQASQRSLKQDSIVKPPSEKSVAPSKHSVSVAPVKETPPPQVEEKKSEIKVETQ